MFMSPEYLSPQLSSIESLRSSIPEEHRKLFDSLQQDIKDYCASHNLPTPSLTSREAFITAAQKNRTPPDVLNHIILLLKRFDYLTEHKEPMPEEREMTEQYAREIMGRNFLGTKEVEEHFGELSPEQEEALSIIPFSQETLEECKDTHILVADIGLSIMDLKKLEKCKGLFFDQDWYEAEDFFKHTDQPSWRLIRKTPVEDSFFKSWKEQQALFNPQTDEIPFARQVIYTTILHFLGTRERLLKTGYVRTSSVVPHDYHVYVGRFNGDGLFVHHWRDHARSGHIGIASARKSINPS
jgi:hypothetical protein